MIFSKTPGGYYRHAEQLDQTAKPLLAEIGYSPEDIAHLRTTSPTGPTDGSMLRGYDTVLRQLDDVAFPMRTLHGVNQCTPANSIVKIR